MKRVNRPTKVDVSFDERGRPRVQRFSWEGKMLPVTSMGRSWIDKEGRHMLVMAGGDRVFELLLERTELRWRVLGYLPRSYMV